MDGVTSVAEQRAEFGMDAGNPEVTPLRATRFNSVNPEYYSDLQALQDKYAERPPAPAFVINLNPYPLRLNQASMQGIVIPACGSDEEFALYRFTTVHYEMKLTGDGKYTPVAFEPYVRARAFIRQQHDLNRGGVVMFEGDKDPETDPKILAAIKIARQEMVSFAREKKQEADNEWNTPSRKGARNINELHRGLTLMLLREGIVEKAPEWLDRTVVEANKGEQCPKCRVYPERDAMQCGCGWILDVEKAWDMGAIDEQNVALRRLSRDKLEEMGLSDYVEETLEERNLRVKEESATNPDRDLTPAQKAARTRAENKAREQAAA